MRVYLESLGCRLNHSEIETLARQFVAAGHVLTGDPASADTCVLNTCAVTAAAERKSRRRARALARLNPQAALVVAGCYVTLAPERAAALPGVRWSVPNAVKSTLVQQVTGVPVNGRLAPLPADWGHTRAFVKVQEGCDQHCTYCITARLRGPSRSRPLPAVVDEVRGLAGAGYREAVLTGVQLGAYGRDLQPPSGLAALVDAVLSGSDLARLRLSSVEPWDLDEALLAQWSAHGGRLCRQLHLPLQAGCDCTLHRMGRPITTAQYACKVQTARAAVPDLALTADVLVGFPGEDEAAFEESLQFVREMAFARLHVFPYSERPGTPAARLPGAVPRQVREERATRMRALGAGLERAFQRRFAGRELDVLWEQRDAAGRWHGHSDNYLHVVARSPCDLRNRITPVRLLHGFKEEDEDERFLLGEIL